MLALAMPNRITAVAGAVERLLGAAGLDNPGQCGPGQCGASGDALVEAADALRLALTEVLNNIVEHGGGPNIAPQVGLRLWQAGRAVVVCVDETGPALPDWIAAPPHAAPPQAVPPHAAAPGIAPPGAAGDDLAMLPEGGWGLMLIHASVDRVTAHRRDGRNFLFLEKVLPACPTGI
ncbi:MAG: ATP-binding protein [Thermohalobaculum sp.]|nr:ATP-binding protein [Thermohalobaculum sp.]